MLVARAGQLAALVLLGVSAFMNWRYGLSLARDDVDRVTFGVASLGADALKAVAPFYIWAAWRERRLVMGAAALALWSIASCYALASALGFAALSRAEVAGTTIGQQEMRAGLKSDLTRKQAERAALGTPEPARVIAVKLDAQRQSWRWSASKSCQEITLKETRAFCDGVNVLLQEQAKAIEAERLDSEVMTLRERIGGLASVSSLDRGDPQAGLIARLSGLHFEDIQLGLTLLVVVLVELGSGLGLLLATRYAEIVGRPAMSRPEPLISMAPPTKLVGDVATFVLTCLDEDADTTIAIDQLHASYVAWCVAQSFDALPIEMFRTAFARLATEIGYPLDDCNGTAICTGLVAISSSPTPSPEATAGHRALPRATARRHP